MVRHLLEPFLSAFSRLYFGTAGFRRLVDATGLTRRFLRSPFFRRSGGRGGGVVVEVRRRIASLDRTGVHVVPDGPVLIDRRVRSDGGMLHLVNYADTPVRVVVKRAGAVRLSTPDVATRIVSGAPDELVVELETWAVLVWEA